MAQNISWLGHSWTAVPAVTLPKTGGGTAKFADASPTTAAAADVASGKVFLGSDGELKTGTASGGGGGGLTLLTTMSLGTISTTSTQAASTGKTIVVSGINAYDALLVVSAVETRTANRHVGTANIIYLTASTASTDISVKDGATVGGGRFNTRLSNTSVMYAYANGSTGQGIYPYSCTINNGTASILMYRRYNATNTGTINGTYTAKVYGIKLSDMD